MPETKPKVPRESPTCNCILLCDDVLVSQGKGKHILHGIIGAIVVPQIPALVGPYVAYIRLSNVYGAQKISVTLAHGPEDDTIFQFEVTLPTESNPLGVYTLVVPIRPFPVAEAGRYMFTVSSDGVPLAQTPIMIQSFDTSPPENDYRPE